MMNTNRDTVRRGFQVVPSSHQKGMATLVVTVVILIIITLMVFFAAKVGIFDQRMSGNEYRYKEAFAVADGGLEYATQQFTENVSNIGGSYLYDPDKNGTADAIPVPFLSDKNLTGGAASSSEAQFTASVGTTTTSGVTVYTLISLGESIDRTGTASVSEQIVIRPIAAGNTPDTPIIADGSMDVTGNMHVVPNPNGSCPDSDSGCAVSVWTHETVDTGSSISTCQMQGFSGGQCPNPSLDPLHTQITNADDQGVDIIQSDPYTTASPAGNFPPDLFDYIFGVPYTQWQTIKSAAESLTPSQVYSDCNSLNASSKGIIWITGDCQINAGAIIGSEANPVILVVQNQDLDVGGNATIYGVVYLFDETPTNNADDPDLDLGGGTQIRGSLISGVDLSGGSGTVAVVWDPNIFNNIQNNSDESYRQVASIPGSWNDF